MININQYPIQLAMDINLNLYTSKNKNIDATELMFLDVLTTLASHNQYNKSDNITFREFIHSCNIDKVKNNKINKPVTIKFNMKQLKKKLPFLKKIKKNKFFLTIIKLSDTIFNINYPIRIIEKGKYISKENYVNSEPFTFVSHDNNDNYEICFDTEFGICLMNNVLYSHHSLILEKFYNLNKTTQLFYRFLILPYWGKTKKNISIELVRERLGLLSNVNNLKTKIIPKILDSLVKNNFITWYKFDQIT